MIERWFPCAEVSANSDSGWGSGNQERSVFTWFAARPTSQAKAAVICSLLPWPDQKSEQERLQSLVRRAMTGRYAAWLEICDEISKANPHGVAVLDPFSGRGIVPLESARLGLQTHAVDYSPMAVLASRLLTEFPFIDWSSEPDLPFEIHTDRLLDGRPKLVQDVESVLREIGRRHREKLADFYPPGQDGDQPWGYLWAVTLPCVECGARFPLIGSYTLRHPLTKRTRNGIHQDPGQSFYIAADRISGTFSVVVHDGPAIEIPTLRAATTVGGKKQKGKSACCPFCKHEHPLQTHQRLAQERCGEDVLLAVAELDDEYGKVFREPRQADLDAIDAASTAVAQEPNFSLGLPARPDEEIPENNGATIRPQLYGAATYGDLMCDRQTLSYIRLCRIIDDLDREFQSAGVSSQYRQALSGYAAANLVRMIKTATRGARLYPNSRPGSNRTYVDHIYSNESTIAFNYDFFEVGIGSGPGSWEALSGNTVNNLKSLMDGLRGTPCSVTRGSATSLAHRPGSIQAVVTDPPYDSMVYYSDASDLLYVWLKRALASSDPSIALAAGGSGVQDKSEEIIVKEHGKSATEHRTRDHYDSKIALAFAEMRRVVRQDGIVTVVFGHGEPEVWQRFLSSIQQAGLVMTGSWPANTEAGGQQGKANIETTLTMACRPAPPDRPIGRKGAVEAEIKMEIKQRYPDWERWGLAPADMLMAAAGPAMEVVGRYSEVRDKNGDAVDIHTFLPLARAAVQDALIVEIDNHPLNTFDARTRFALWWVSLYGKQVQAKSELRWQSLASSLDVGDVRDLVPDADKGIRFIGSKQFKGRITAESAVIDVALALAAASDQGLNAMGEVVAASGRAADDAYIWATVQFLARRLPEQDPDNVAFTRVVRTRSGIASATEVAVAAEELRHERQSMDDRQLKLL